VRIWLFLMVFTDAVSAQQPQPSELVLHGGTRESCWISWCATSTSGKSKTIRAQEVEIFEDARETLKGFQYRTGKEAQPVNAMNTLEPRQ
jgi:hypothetical protein